MKHFGGQEGNGEPLPQPQQLAESLILGPERGEELGGVGRRVPLRAQLDDGGAAGLGLFGPFLQPEKRNQHGLADGGGDGLAPGARGEEGSDGEAHTEQEEPGVAAGQGPIGPESHAQNVSTLRYFSKSSRMRPDARTTQVSGSSST